MIKTFYLKSEHLPHEEEIKVQSLPDGVISVRRKIDIEHYEELLFSPGEYSRYMWSLPSGSGQVELPFHLLASIVDFAPILNHFKNGAIFPHTEIYDKTLIANLFPKEEDKGLIKHPSD